MTPTYRRFGLLDGLENSLLLLRPADPGQPPRLLSPPERAVAALLTAWELLARRGSGPDAWSTPFRQDPVAFLLDSVNDAVSLWGPDGAVVYSNRAAAEIGFGHCDGVAVKDFVRAGRRYERRCVRIEYQAIEYVLEILHEVRL